MSENELIRLENLYQNLLSQKKQLHEWEITLQQLIDTIKKLIYAHPNHIYSQRKFLSAFCCEDMEEKLCKVSKSSQDNSELGVIRIKSKDRCYLKIGGKAFYFQKSIVEDNYLKISTIDNLAIKHQLNKLKIDWKHDSNEIIKNKMERSETPKQAKTIASQLSPEFDKKVPFTRTPPHSVVSTTPKSPTYDFLFGASIDNKNGGFFHLASAKDKDAYMWMEQAKKCGEVVLPLEYSNQYGLLYSKQPFSPNLHQRLTATSWKNCAIEKLTLRSSGEDSWRTESRAPVVTVGMTTVKCLLNREVERLKKIYPNSVLVQFAESKEIKNDGTMVITCSPEIEFGICLTWRAVKKYNLMNYVVGAPLEPFVATHEDSKEISCWIAPVLGSNFEQQLSSLADALHMATGPKEENFLNERFNSHSKEDRALSFEYLSLLQDVAETELSTLQLTNNESRKCCVSENPDFATENSIEREGSNSCYLGEELAVAKENVHKGYQLIIKLILSRNPTVWEGMCTKVLKTGFGSKRGAKEKSAFLQRLFILTADQLHYIEPSGLVVKGTIDLRRLIGVYHSQQYEKCLELTTGCRTYYIKFAADHIHEWKRLFIKAAQLP